VFAQLKDILPSLVIHLIEANIEGKESESIQLSNGIDVHWHSSLTNVPYGFNYFIAHEFFDVLPIHQFIDIGKNEWREIFVDIETETKSLKFVKSPNPTPASLAYTQLLGGGYKEFEVCPDGLLIIEEVSRRVKTNGGGALIADYGDVEIKDFTFR
ncbi:PREDICTED: protein arginine methyltransferase NDUFAF7, mitochondrial-like, partial [Amphimedon queenslandica]|uniref:Protein arginine methyltransferase NDUFAF7 n=1 Tax=Amphimedon queenslandica TaxID=400682 RepID=A0AAN0IUS2_AMPQE